MQKLLELQKMSHAHQKSVISNISEQLAHGIENADLSLENKLFFTQSLFVGLAITSMDVGLEKNIITEADINERINLFNSLNLTEIGRYFQGQREDYDIALSYIQMAENSADIEKSTPVTMRQNHLVGMSICSYSIQLLDYILHKDTQDTPQDNFDKITGYIKNLAAIHALYADNLTFGSGELGCLCRLKHFELLLDHDDNLNSKGTDHINKDQSPTEFLEDKTTQTLITSNNVNVLQMSVLGRFFEDFSVSEHIPFDSIGPAQNISPNFVKAYNAAQKIYQSANPSHPQPPPQFKK